MLYKKILIIGGTGYIGSSIHPFLKQYYDVVTCDLEWRGNKSNYDNILIDFNHLESDYIRSFDSIILLGGHSTVSQCIKNPKESMRNNISKFINLVNVLDPNQTFIYASSASVYGDTEGSVCTEDCELSTPINTYDFAKMSLDNIAKFSNLNYYGLRFGTVCGYAPNIRPTVINAMYDSAIKSNEILLSGSDKYRGILGINDLNKAIKRIIDFSSFEKRGVYNLSSFNINMKDMAEYISRFTGASIKEVDSVSDERTNSPYNFKINCNKFSDNFHFSFNESIRTILKSLEEHI